MWRAAGLLVACAFHLGSAPRAVAETDTLPFQRASSHPIRYHLVLPHAYSRQETKTWPVLVCIAGAGADFQALARHFAAARGDRPFLIVVPCTFSNTNLLRGPMLEHFRKMYSQDEIHEAAGTGWLPDRNRRLDSDEAGLLAILADLREAHRIEPRIHLTGFSGGGLLVYRMVVKHPDLLASAIPVCPNFWGRHYRDLPQASPDESALPVRILLGEHDPLRNYRKLGELLPRPGIVMLCVAFASGILALLVWKKSKKWRQVIRIGVVGALLLGAIEAGRWTGIDAQTDAATALLSERGFTKVERLVLPGRQHEPAADQVFCIAEQLPARLHAEPSDTSPKR
jgi:poly(3-hydroxybutyrate) depolymerase